MENAKVQKQKYEIGSIEVRKYRNRSTEVRRKAAYRHLVPYINYYANGHLKSLN